MNTRSIVLCPFSYSTHAFTLVALLAIAGWTSHPASAASTLSIVPTLAAGRTFSEDAGEAQIEVAREGDTNESTTVDFLLIGDTAVPGSDYVDASGTLSFEAGQTHATIRIPLLDDNFPEVPVREVFQLRLNRASDNAEIGQNSEVTLTIVDEDPGIQVEFAQYSADEGSGTVVIGVTRGPKEDFPATVEIATRDENALAGSHFVAVADTLRFAAGERLKLVAIRLLNDGLNQGTRSFRFLLGAITGPTGLGTTKHATVTIRDNDPGIHFATSLDWVSEDEGFLRLEVRRGNDGLLEPVTVEYATTNLTATASEDYEETRGTLWFEAGEMTRTVSVPILADALTEADERFRVVLHSPSEGAELGSPVLVTVNILDMTGMEPHRFGNVRRLADGQVEMTLRGGVHKRFFPYFDLYPIEVSSDLRCWEPLSTLVRANSSTNQLIYVDSAAASTQQTARFYRTPTGPFLTPVSPPTGPWPVGITSRLLTDSARRNRYSVSTNGSFMISVWYPAVARVGLTPARFEDFRLSEDASFAIAEGEAASIVDRQRSFVAHALADPGFRDLALPCPVVVYSPGGLGVRREIMERGPELASHGYVVVSADPWDAYATEFPDGTYLHGATSLSQITVSRARTLDRVRDLQVVMDHLQIWNVADPLLAGRLDLEHVATMGMSWGGGIAAEAARLDSRVDIAVALDPGFIEVDELLRVGMSKPCLTVCNPSNTDLRLYDKLRKDAFWFQLRSTVHNDFWDYYWLAGSGRLASQREATATVNRFVLWFLNTHLKGMHEPMPALADYPRVINFKQK